MRWIKDLNISYINFANFFVETQDRKLYYAKLKKTGEAVLKNLKIDMVVKPADVDVIIRDINAYGAFKYHNVTVKYDDIKEYIDNPLISPKEELSWVIDNVRKYESARRVQERIKEESKKEIKAEKKVEPSIIEETKPLEELKKINFDSHKVQDSNSEEPKVKKHKKIKEHKDKKFKGSLAMYCLIGFTAGVFLAAITIVIGSFI